MSASENRPVRTRAASRQIWVERLQRFADSAVTVVAFCQSEGISSHAFYYCKHKLPLNDSAPAPLAEQPRLLPVRLLDAAPIELVLPNGCSLRLGRTDRRTVPDDPRWHRPLSRATLQTLFRTGFVSSRYLPACVVFTLAWTPPL
jgi:hypothetical protein